MSTSLLRAGTRRGATLASPPIWLPAGRAPRTSPGCSPPSPVTDREVLAFDLYGTLVDPIAVSNELDQVLGGSDGAAVAAQAAGTAWPTAGWASSSASGSAPTRS